jgi:serine/threonine protein kinase/Tfp pilus assembly protein PilF
MESLTEGAQVGHYRLTGLIGSGGMGDVYRARDLVLGRDVALKFVAAAGTGNDTLKARLLQEAQSVAALDHPSICAVHEVGVDGSGRAYMVMPYIEGETLAARLAHGPMPVREALTMCALIADALAAAHRRGIIHRDLKPQNVMVTPSGQPRLLDFGIAKVLPWADSSAPTTEAPGHVTGTHGPVGTPGYMSPEQVEQRRLDGRSDLFSLGAMLFECLTGRRAFDGHNALDVFRQILHVHPDPPSRLRAELDERHDELCRRLLAKDPEDRFKSADEVVGALRLLQPDSSRPRDTEPGGSIPAADRPEGLRSRLRRHAKWLAPAVGVVILASAAVARWRVPALSQPSAEAARWYDRGTEALREGSFHSATAALDEAIELSSEFPAAYARLAEARAEIDDDRAAQQTLVRVSNFVPDESRLPQDDRLRLTAIRSLVLGEADRAVQAYHDLADRHPENAGGWVDLGRSQEAAGQITDARASYQRAVKIDPQYAAAFLRLGNIDAAEGRRASAAQAYSEAERLYRAASNVEGEAEVLIRRGAMLDWAGEFRDARASLERALSIARTIRNPFQIVRAQMHLSSVTASDGRLVDSETLASTAVQSALDAGLETTAADGLIDLAHTLTQESRPKEAEAHLRKALELAEKRGARRTAARARTQMAALHLDQERPAEALAVLEPALEFFREHTYRRYELTALSIASRAYQQLDQIPKAHELATRVLNVAETTHDDAQVSVALANLASQATTLGSLPDALALRERAQAIHRRQGDAASLPYDLTNRAELLIRLGRLDAAAAALAEADEGIRKKIDVYMGRQRRVTFLRMLAAVVALRMTEAIRFGRTLQPDPASVDSATVLGPALLAYAEAKQGQRRALSRFPADTPSNIPPVLQRERHYWSAAAALAAGGNRQALTTALAGLKELSHMNNDELEWRLAAVGSLAARGLGLAGEQGKLRTRASEALARLRSRWGVRAHDYENRPDLAELRTAAAL